MRLSEDMKSLIAEQRLCYAATVCPDGTPNLSPKGTIATFDDSTIMFADIRSPQTVANLRQNPAIEVNVVDPVRRRGYRLKVGPESHEMEKSSNALLACTSLHLLILSERGSGFNTSCL